MRVMSMILIWLLMNNSFANNLFSNITSWFYSPTFKESSVNEEIFPKQRAPSYHNLFIFDPKKHAWAVYDKQGHRVGYGLASGGKDYCADINKPCQTVVGEYTVFRKEDKDCTSNTFPIDEGGGAPMPHCMFFYKGYAIHGSKHLGFENLSHGCIRVSEEAAEWMNKYYIHEGSLVIVLPYA